MTNELNVSLFGVRRGGNHAVVNWLAAHYVKMNGEPVWFMNDVNDFSKPRIHKDDTDVYEPDEYRDGPATYDDYFSIPKKVFFQSYEDKFIDGLDFQANEKAVGDSETRLNVLIIRDPFNLLASRICFQSLEMKVTDKIIRIWKQHAREALGLTNHLPGLIVVDYNRWFSSPEYRRELEQKMGLPECDDGMERVYGVGSSFGGRENDGSASTMGVGDRWRECSSDCYYRELVEDRELWDLSDRLEFRTAEPLRPRGKIRFFLTNDGNKPTGGVKQVHRQVDILNGQGYDAAIIGMRKEDLCTWFDHNTRMTDKDEGLFPGDYLVLSEVLPQIPKIKGADSANIVVYAQNPFSMLRGFGGPGKFGAFYEKSVKAVMCVSEHSRNSISALVSNDVYRIRYSFDRPPFGPPDPGQKKKIISYMSRRRKEDIMHVLRIACGRGWLRGGWKIRQLDGMSEGEVADALRESAIFIAGGLREGFGMPPAEAMACGCHVIGWGGHAGQEFFEDAGAVMVPEDDVIACSLALGEALKTPFESLVEKGQRASDYIRKAYSTEREIESVNEAWRGITRGSVFPLNDVAAFVSTYDEGEYLEAVLAWLSPRVGRVYVMESKTTFHACQSVDHSRTKGIVDKIGASNIVYHELEGREHPKPDIKEAHERNQALEMIEADGFKWVWVVDADELYMDGEAEALWSYFLKKASDVVQGARCHWYTYWRSMDWRVEPPESFHPNIIIRSSCRVDSSRHLRAYEEQNIMTIPPEVCIVRHYSWAHTPSHIKRKTQTWTHAHQVSPDWFDKVFAKWQPGDEIRDFHPTDPFAYQNLVRRTEPVPEALSRHPYIDVEVIEDEVIRPIEEAKRLRIKVAILNHNYPENSDRLYEQLVDEFDDVEIIDSGSDPDKIPVHVGRCLSNVYWSGGWNELLRDCSDYDVVWMLGCDITLKDEASDYRSSIESAMPFGCWSPCIEGRAKPFMQRRHYEPKTYSVRNVEGMAMALSGELMRELVKLIPGSDGYGQDFWLCFCARGSGLRCIMDGRVCVHHPEGTGYSDEKFHKQMDKAFGDIYGPDYRKTIFQYDDRFEVNVLDNEETRVNDKKTFTIVTVDNGWSYPEFLSITEMFPEARRIIMRKGVAEIPPCDGVEIIQYDKGMSVILKEADVAVFPKVGVAVKKEFDKILAAGIPVVVHVDFSDGIPHMEGSLHYQVAFWAQKWISALRDDPSISLKIKSYWEERAGEKTSDPVGQVPSPPDVRIAAPTVSVITPTWGRDVKIVKRCIDSLQLQDAWDWEQLVCSNGPEEPEIRRLVENIDDPRVSYFHLDNKPGDNDFGNSARKQMIEKARGSYLCFVDDDNIVLPAFLFRMLHAIGESGKDFAVCEIMHFGPLNEEHLGPPPIVLKGDPVKLYHVDPLQVLVKREAMREIGWDTEEGYLSDGITLEKLGDKFDHIRVDEVLGVHL